MNREELVEAGMQAMSSSLSPRAKEVWVTRILDAVEPLIRADERNGRESWAEVVVRADAAIRTEVLADLRARVEALHTTGSVSQPRLYINRDQVLALIDGSGE